MLKNTKIHQKKRSKRTMSERRKHYRLSNITHMTVKEKIKLLVGSFFSIAIVTMLITIVGMIQVKAGIEEFVQGPYKFQGAANRLSKSIQSVQSDTRELFVVDEDKRTAIIQDLITHGENMKAELLNIQEEMTEEVEIIEELEELVTHIIVYKNRIIKLVQSGEMTGAYTYMDMASGKDEARALEIIEQIIVGIEKTATDIIFRVDRIQYSLLGIMILASVIMGFAIKWSTMISVKIISNPLNEVVESAKQVALGNFSIVPSYESKDEIGQVAASIREMIGNVKGYISEVDERLEHVEQGRLTESITMDFQGEFIDIKEHINSLIGHLNHTINQINHASVQVSEGASQSARGAAQLSHQISEQVEIMNYFTQSVSDISMNIEEGRESIAEATRVSYQSKEKAIQGLDKMENLLVAMDEIGKSSHDVGKIIIQIEEIAKKTNLLAFNASIEATRAGESGRGFAVLANEIRDLANKSSFTVKEVQRIIGNSIQAVEKGNLLAHGTATELKSIADTVEETVVVNKRILESSEVQKEIISVILERVGTISALLESDAKNAEDSSLVSEELLAQANALKELVEYFEV